MEEITTVCMYCHKIKVGDEWIKHDYDPLRYNYSHGICPDDYKIVNEDLDNMHDS